MKRIPSSEIGKGNAWIIIDKKKVDRINELLGEQFPSDPSCKINHNRNVYFIGRSQITDGWVLYLKEHGQKYNIPAYDADEFIMAHEQESPKPIQNQLPKGLPTEIKEAINTLGKYGIHIPVKHCYIINGKKLEF